MDRIKVQSGSVTATKIVGAARDSVYKSIYNLWLIVYIGNLLLDS